VLSLETGFWRVNQPHVLPSCRVHQVTLLPNVLLRIDNDLFFGNDDAVVDHPPTPPFKKRLAKRLPARDVVSVTSSAVSKIDITGY